MTLPFTLDQFLDVFGAYNRALWPAALLLWGATVAAFLAIVRGDPRTTRIVGALLAVHWAWAGGVYHLAYFRSINPAALPFGVLFLVQAGLFLWWTLRAPPAAFAVRTNNWAGPGVLLMAFALAYPAVGLLFGLTYPRMPTFGVPCPTTLFTVGVLLVARDAMPRWLGIIPLAWTVVGGSAAFFFGIRADMVLAVSGLALLANMVLPTPKARAG